MGVELKPLGVKCNIQCQYCYQNPIRDAGNLPHSYDLNRMLEAVAAEGAAFSLFGGEPLLMPRDDLEKLWAFGLARFGRNSIQTNGTLIDDNLIRMFKQYRVRVGLSLDGPGELNDARWCGSLSKTRSFTRRSQLAVERLCREKIPLCLIITISRVNAAPDRLPALCDWVRYLDEIGVRWARIHVLESENRLIHAAYSLTTEENIQAFLALAGLEKRLARLRFDVFRDIYNLLQGRDDAATCVWTGCDPYTTEAVIGIEGNGQRSNCGRTNKDGIDYVKSDLPGFERYLALYSTPQQAGGCKHCRFFLMCKGQCPGTAIDGDWRNRTEHCEVWKALFTAFEREIEASGFTPVSRSPRRKALELAMLSAWAQGRNTTMASHTSLWRDGETVA
jgi:uncharacterized protein